MTVSARAGGVWNGTIDPSVNVGGEWKAANGIYARQGGVWQEAWTKAGFYPYSIPYSMYTPFGSSGNLYRTWYTPFDSPTRLTISCWFKQDETNWTYSYCYLYNHIAASSNFGFIRMTQGKITVRDYHGSTESYGKETQALFSQTPSWHHLCVTIDTNNAVAADRMIIAFDGNRVTSFATDYGDFPLGYSNMLFLKGPPSGSSCQTFILKYGVGSLPYSLNGNFAEFRMIEGFALGANTFGEFKNSLWIPKEYTGGYGSHGYIQDYCDDGFLGKDVSGNDNHFQSASVSQDTDTPTSVEPL